MKSLLSKVFSHLSHHSDGLLTAYGRSEVPWVKRGVGNAGWFLQAGGSFPCTGEGDPRQSFQEESIFSRTDTIRKLLLPTKIQACMVLGFTKLLISCVSPRKGRLLLTSPCLPHRYTQTKAITLIAPSSSSIYTGPSSTSLWNASGFRTSYPQSQQKKMKRRTSHKSAGSTDVALSTTICN